MELGMFRVVKASGPEGGEDDETADCTKHAEIAAGHMSLLVSGRLSLSRAVRPGGGGVTNCTGMSGVSPARVEVILTGALSSCFLTSVPAGSTDRTGWVNPVDASKKWRTTSSSGVGLSKVTNGDVTDPTAAWCEGVDVAKVWHVAFAIGALGHRLCRGSRGRDAFAARAHE